MRTRLLACSVAVLTIALSSGVLRTTRGGAEVLLAQGAVTNTVDLDALAKIRKEASSRSKVMEIVSDLSDVYGSRLTGSPTFKAAGDYAMRKFAEWGLTARLEPWGPFDRGWWSDHFSANVVAPYPYPLIGYPRAWTPGTNGPVVADAVLPVLETDQDIARLRGTLKGKIVLIDPVREVALPLAPPARRYTDAELTEIAGPETKPPRQPRLTPQQREFQTKREQFLASENVTALVECSRITDGGTVLVARSGARRPEDPPTPTQVILAVEHYNRIARTLAKGVAVRVALDIRNNWSDPDMSFNVIGELKGTEKPDEVVLIGAHFDSWNAGTGATDNAAGCATAMEALRILKATGLTLRRTVRVAMWGGEEHGSLGAKAYIQKHLTDAGSKAPKAGYGTFSTHFNLDAGAGAIRGVYLQGNEAAAPIVKAWLGPFRDGGAATVSIRNSNVNSDHQAFDAVGLPAFMFIQDPLDYDTRTHHTNMDTVERVPAADLLHNAIILASLAYHAANQEGLMPRKPAAGR